MLSLTGSIQSDPFSPSHVPENAHNQQQEATSKSHGGASPDPFGDEVPDAAEDSDEDTFGMLGRLGDEAAAQDAERRAKEEEDARREKKRKRKEAKAQMGTGDTGQEKKSKKKKIK